MSTTALDTRFEWGTTESDTLWLDLAVIAGGDVLHQSQKGGATGRLRQGHVPGAIENLVGSPKGSKVTIVGFPY